MLVPGFGSRDDAIRIVEAGIGRDLVDLEWYEIFALVRASAVSTQDRPALRAAGPAPMFGVGDDPTLAGGDPPHLSALRSTQHAGPARVREGGRQLCRVGVGEAPVGVGVRRGATTPDRSSPTARPCSGFRSTLPVAVRGIASVMRTNRGAHFVPRSGCSARNAAKASGSKVAPASSSTAAITWSPLSGSGTPYTTTDATPGKRSMIRSTGPAAKFSPSTRNQSLERPAK